MREIDGEQYLNTQEVMAAFGASKKRFYGNIRPALREYNFDGKKTPWYRLREVEAFKYGRVERQAPIVISGQLRDWTEYVRSMGFQVDTVSREIDIVSLEPAQLPTTFQIAPYQQFARRDRISFVMQTPICIWSTYYPLALVHGDMLDRMKCTPDLNVVQALAERGTVITQARDRYSARLATIPEQEMLQLTRDEPVLILQRVSHTHDGRLVLYSHMTLLGSWFAPEHEYSVTHWQASPVQSVAPEQDSSELAPGLVAWRAFSRLHGLPIATIQSAIERGEIPVVEGGWQIGRTKLTKALDAAGRAAIYRQYRSHPNFVECPDCPHT